MIDKRTAYIAASPPRRGKCRFGPARGLLGAADAHAVSEKPGLLGPGSACARWVSVGDGRAFYFLHWRDGLLYLGYRGPRCWAANETRVVLPPKAAEVVALSKVSAFRSPPAKTCST
jgi:hypothetical protein